MKKKFSLIVLVVIVSIVGFLLAKNLQQKALKNTANKEISIQNEKISDEDTEHSIESKDNTSTKNTDTKTKNPKKNDAKANTSNSGKSNKKTNVTVPKSTVNLPEKQSNTSTNSKQSTNSDTANSKPKTEKPNITIKNEVTGKIIASMYVELDGLSAADATIKVLDTRKIRYRAINSSTGLYFSSIAGIKERSAGPASGWCYYVNGNKPSVGASSFKLKKSDVVQWKFLENGF